MTADADKPAKMRTERTAKVQESLRMLSEAHAHAHEGVRALPKAVAAMGGEAAARYAALQASLATLQGAYERVVGACREQGVTA